jgi:large subunit ribosomal protein L4
LGIADSSVLVVSTGGDRNLMLSARNIPDVTVTTGAALNTYQLLLCDKLVFTRGAYEQFEQRLNKN